MGFYVNPQGQNKTTFLQQKGEKVSNSFKWNTLPKGKLPVVLIDNGPFTAAGIAYNEREFNAFTDPSDRRPKEIYIVPVSDLLVASGPDFAKYAKENGLL